MYKNGQGTLGMVSWKSKGSVMEEERDWRGADILGQGMFRKEELYC